MEGSAALRSGSAVSVPSTCSSPTAMVPTTTALFTEKPGGCSPGMEKERQYLLNDGVRLRETIFSKGMYSSEERRCESPAQISSPILPSSWASTLPLGAVVSSPVKRGCYPFPGARIAVRSTQTMHEKHLPLCKRRTFQSTVQEKDLSVLVLIIAVNTHLTQQALQ